MSERIRESSRSLVLGLVSLGWGAAIAAVPGAWTDRVDPAVIEAASRGPVEVMVVLDEQADLSRVEGGIPRRERGRRVIAELTDTAQRTQAPLVAWLESRGIEHRAYWIANVVWVRAALSDLGLLAERDDVRRIELNPRVRFAGPDPSPTEAPVPTSLEWGVQKILADQVWALGYDGTGVVVGGQDTGYQWNHPALIEHYRGWNGSTASHAYNWHDAIHGGGGVCGANSTFPCDDHGHGTHTMGTMVGDDGGSNQIGVAPGAKWIGCRNMDQGDGTPATYAECFQWFVAPTDAAGQNPDPDKSPDVINNSWGCPPSEGCAALTLQLVVENTKAAGIVVVASAGNSGNSCSTVVDPPAIYAAAFTVGATDSSDSVTGFSSRGPVTVDGSNRLKPEIAAPGQSVRSSVPGGGYSVFSGTSMAGPHVAGVVALLLSARPDLAGRVDDIEQLIELSAFPLTSSQNCGGMPGSLVPNPVSGFGRVDALEMLLADTDDDGTSNLEDCRPLDDSVWSVPSPARDLTLHSSEATTVLGWTAPLSPGGASYRYDVIRSVDPQSFAAATCIATAISGTVAYVPDVPTGGFYYLVRTFDSCGGNLGTASDGTPRTGPTCP